MHFAALLSFICFLEQTVNGPDTVMRYVAPCVFNAGVNKTVVNVKAFTNAQGGRGIHFIELNTKQKIGIKPVGCQAKPVASFQ